MATQRLDLNFFGIVLQNADAVALQRFRECPWAHFEAVPDPYPNRILASDVSLTVVMNSKVGNWIMWQAVERAQAIDASALLAKIPTDLALEDTGEENCGALWPLVDSLFDQLAIPYFRRSRIAKILCRKRLALIPMLDNKVADFLWRIVKQWRDVEGIPSWFTSAWNNWQGENMVSPYMEMIRHDLRQQLPALKDLRNVLHSDPDTEVPKDAPLLRLYESTLWRALMDRRLQFPGPVP